MSKTDRPFAPLNVAILTVSDTRTPETDTSGDTIAEKLKSAGHRVAARLILKDDVDKLRGQVKGWIDDPKVDAVITTGGTGLTQRDITPEALTPLITKLIPGFGELFRHLSYAEIGSSTIESRAFAGICAGTILFCLPGSTGACRLGMDKIILEQLDSRYPPCNLVTLLPRIKHEHAPH
ncbi:MAG: molybdenum cofactor biosynthesis protein B [Candidatus Muproteobacteria bacterium RBG_16_62_13]|uniref:Molybdenum cofactor biosynthesis protein B n=1 Tax=Candidatus Muproteobacteria bacterium RBG_16_62_13 TaxID=1817756 RepID=A0A1F6T7T2_9PROT|nr:MAG: molybdenum cofactor biosynthesis protein B [Candidatus Muproteobacteria bacterium RBG_16_62_13]